MTAPRNTFVVHILRHCGWHTTRAEGDTFSDAAVDAVCETLKKFNLDLDTIPHRVEFRDGDYPRVVFYETEARPVWNGVTVPGDLWFGQRVREGEEDDCTSCGGTGLSHYNFIKQCWACGDSTERGPSSGKAVVKELS